MADVRIDLNYHDLFKLLVADDGTEEGKTAMLNIRRGVAENFAQHYLKAFINHDLMVKTKSEILTEVTKATKAEREETEKLIKDEVTRQLGATRSGYGATGRGSGATLPAERKDAIKDAVTKAVSDEIEAVIKSEVAMRLTPKILEGMKKVIETEVDSRLKSIAASLGK
jgi:hypothetical protein